MMWFCGGCLEDQEGSVWDGWDKETGKCLCKKCKVTPHNDGPEHYCTECKPKEPQNEQISAC